MSKRSNDFQSINELMRDVFKENNLQEGLDELAIKDAWIEVMGQGVMSYTNQLKYANGLLIVQLKSSALREELSYGREKIITMLNENLKKSVIKRIKLL